jgi:pimeloyl-ACP methyl ester carboxylesterase
VLDIEVARRMAQRMPRGQYAEIDDSYHHVMFDNPAALIAALDAFLISIR